MWIFRSSYRQCWRWMSNFRICQIWRFGTSTKTVDIISSYCKLSRLGWETLYTVTFRIWIQQGCRSWIFITTGCWCTCQRQRVNIPYLGDIMNVIFYSCFSGLVPLHNACSYGHYEVTELLVKHGANVNVADLWKFTPLHEAAAKGKYEIVKLLLKVCLRL